MATVTQKRTMMAMYPATPIKTRGYSCTINGNVRVARSTFFALINDQFIVAADKFLREYVLTEKGRAEAEKAFAKAFPKQQEMIVVPYRYCFNSYGLKFTNWFGSQSTIRIVIAGCEDHTPTLDGYREGDKLTLAYTGEIVAAVTPKGCEALFALFNEPWKRPDEYAGPSMSIGDVVTFYPGTEQEVSFAVNRVGFVKVDISKSEIEQSPERWVRSGEKLDEYRREKAESIEQELF